MSNPNYKRGYRAEIHAKKILESQGYEVMRSAKSGGVFDLIGLNDKGGVVVQVKTCPLGKILPFEGTRAAMKKAKVPENFKRQLWIKEKFRGWHYFII